MTDNEKEQIDKRLVYMKVGLGGVILFVIGACVAIRKMIQGQ